jgi:hypothetical protein
LRCGEYYVASFVQVVDPTRALSVKAFFALPSVVIKAIGFSNGHLEFARLLAALLA